MRSLGFSVLRVRHYGDLARIEVPGEDLVRVLERREQILESLQQVGYRHVTLDLAGYRLGGADRAAAFVPMASITRAREEVS